MVAFIVAAYRPEYFPDVDTYEIMYEFAATGDFNEPAYWISHGEPGFKVLAYLISLAGLDYSSFLLMMSCISGLLLLLISRISSVPFSYLWFTYFSFYFITRDLGVLRLAIASHLVVIFFLQRKFIWQAVTITISSLMFQYLSILAVFAKPLSRFKINWVSISLLFIMSFAMSGFIRFEYLEFLLPNSNYEGSEAVKAAGSSIIVPIARNGFFALLIYFLMKNEIRFQHYRLWIWSAILSVSLYIMASGILIAAQRLSAYFGAVIPLALAYLMYRQSIRRDNFLLIVFFCLLNFASLVYFNSWIWR